MGLMLPVVTTIGLQFGYLLGGAFLTETVFSLPGVGRLVVDRGYTNEVVIARILASQLRLPFTELREGDVSPGAPSLISAQLARLHHCVPIRKEGDCVILAMANPMDLIAIEDVEHATGCRVEPVVATSAAIEFVIARQWGKA